MADEFLYDVAFSFLGKDEALAVKLDDRLKDRLTTFVYSDAERQSRLAGRDGADAFGRVFGTEARTVVVLYRDGWGDQGFTEVESTAIRNRAFEFGWEFITFIPLDKPPTAPRWLPRTRLWIGLDRWGLEHAVTVIESRVQESGGTPRELTVSDVAARALAEIREAGERTAFLDSSKGVEAAQRELDRLFEEVQRVCAESAGLITKPERRNKNTLVSMSAAWSPRSIIFVFELALNNTLQASKLRVVEFDGTHNRETEFHFDFGPSGEHGWRRGTQRGTGEYFTTPRLLDTLAKRLIEAVRDQRTNRQRRSVTS
jgi:hypothetical protein